MPVATNRAAAAPPIGDVEKFLLPVRSVVLSVVAIGLLVLSPSPPNAFTIGVLLAGILYNAVVFVAVRRGNAPGTVGVISSIFHSILAVLGILSTGGVQSPVHPVFTLVLAAMAMRFPLQRALLVGTAFVVMFVLGDWLLAGPARMGERITLAALNLIVVWMVGSLAHRRALERARFLQVAAHELRNPMAGVKGILSLLRTRINAGRPLGDVLPMIEVMEQEIDRLSSLLDAILQAFSVHGGRLALKQERQNLVDIAATALRPFLSSAGRHRFVFEGCDAGEIAVLGDFHRLEDVVRNVLSNGVKYSPDGGEVRLTLGVRGNSAVISVKDQGVGIPKEHLSRIFDGFHRARNLGDKDPGGMGLGLYICRDIVERHAGQIWAESTDGEGTTVYVELPLYSGPAGS